VLQVNSMKTGYKVTYRCNSWRRLGCRFSMYAIHNKDDGSISLHQRGNHIHPLAPQARKHARECVRAACPPHSRCTAANVCHFASVTGIDTKAQHQQQAGTSHEPQQQQPIVIPHQTHVVHQQQPIRIVSQTTPAAVHIKPAIRRKRVATVARQPQLQQLVQQPIVVSTPLQVQPVRARREDAHAAGHRRHVRAELDAQRHVRHAAGIEQAGHRHTGRRAAAAVCESRFVVHHVGSCN